MPVTASDAGKKGSLFASVQEKSYWKKALTRPAMPTFHSMKRPGNSLVSLSG
jgi:hypothetical protein